MKRKTKILLTAFGFALCTFIALKFTQSVCDVDLDDLFTDDDCGIC